MSEKDEVAPEAAEEAQKWPLPYNIGMDKLDLIVKAFFQAGADTQKVSANDLLGRTGLNVNTIKGNIKFLSAYVYLNLQKRRIATFLNRMVSHTLRLWLQMMRKRLQLYLKNS
jgi:hypothetical protein